MPSVNSIATETTVTPNSVLETSVHQRLEVRTST